MTLDPQDWFALHIVALVVFGIGAFWVFVGIGAGVTARCAHNSQLILSFGVFLMTVGGVGSMALDVLEKHFLYL